jgi:triphosphatase
MQPMQEIELKFGLTEDAAAAVEATLRARGAQTLAIESQYWDSADRRLASAGLSLRLRRSGSAWEQTVKAGGATPIDRLEDTVPREHDAGSETPLPDLALHASSAAGPLLDAALAPDGGDAAALEPVHRSAVRRSALVIEALGAELEVALDRGVVRAGDRSLPLCELEVELKGGEIGALIAVGRASVDAHAMWLSTITKARRGASLADPAGTRRAVKARRAPIAADADGAAIFRAVLQSCLDQVLANASIVAEGEIDDELVHQLRVGIRRLRIAARELGSWRGALGDAWEAPAADAFRALGRWRDRRTIAASMQQRLVGAGSPAPALGAASRDDDIDPVAVVRAPAFQHALLDLLAFLLEPVRDRAPEDATSGDGEPPAAAVAKRLDRMHRQLRRDAKRFDELDTSARHRARKRLKRLRYLGELVAPLYKTSRVDRFAHLLEPAQDALGGYIDLLVATGLAHEAIDAGDPRGWFNVGWLQAQLPRAMKRCGKRLRKVGGAAPYWR